MTFNRRDLEDDDFNFDNDFDFGDESPKTQAGKATGDDADFDFGGDDDAFAFEEEPDIDIDQGDTFDLNEADIPDIEGEETREGEGGPNRTFILLAAAMIILFLIGLGAVLILATRETPPTPNQLTATAIVATNQAIETQVVVSQTAAFQIALAQTQTAQVPSPTNTLPPPPTDTPTLPPVDTPTPDDTVIAANAILTQQALSLTETQTAIGLTQTALAVTPPTQEIRQDDVALTATALFLLLQPGTETPGIGGGFASPTPEGGTLVAGGPTPVRPTALPQTGFFEDVAAGGGSNVGMIALMALGLLGVIVVSRRLRTVSADSDK